MLGDSRLTRDEALAVLHGNVGFEHPERWVEIAIRKNFVPVAARRVPVCPDCGGQRATRVGQFVYYCTSIRLRRCVQCRLVWADAHLPRTVTDAHFETAYKDRDYFAHRRRLIFEHLVDHVSRLVPVGGRVLDIGGAQGDLMHLLRAKRADIHPVVQDISESALRYAATTYGLDVIPGALEGLAAHTGQYDAVVLSDVLYYEPDLPRLWELLRRLLADGGHVVIRVPNKLWLISMTARVQDLCMRRENRELQQDVPFFNPEHLYVFDRAYLRSRLVHMGFRNVRFRETPVLMGRPGAFSSAAVRGLRWFGAAAAKVTGGRMLLSPAMLVSAQRSRE